MANAQTCYFPDGSVAKRDTPCHSSSMGEGVSACCLSAHICLDNNLCLHQDGTEQISRGSCTDRTWQSSECAQYCSDVNVGRGTGIHLVDVDNEAKLCCSNMNPFNNTCLVSTKGSSSPFSIGAGLVIFNRKSGSTSPNSTDTVTVTVTSTITATATAAALNPPSIPTTLSSPSSRRDTTIAAGVCGLLGLGLLVALGLLWKQGKHKQSLRKDVQTWKGNYSELMKTKTVNVGGAKQQPSCQIDGWIHDELDGQSHLPAQLEGWRPSEIDGTQIYGVANSMGRA